MVVVAVPGSPLPGKRCGAFFNGLVAPESDTETTPYPIAGPTDLLVIALQLRQRGRLTRRQQARLRVDAQFVARIGDVEVAHRQLADAVARRERRSDLLHRQAFR